MEKADEEPIVTALDQMIEAEDLIFDEEAIYLPPFYYSEVGVANKIKRLLEESSGNLFDGTHDIEEIVKQTSIQYDDIQVLAPRLSKSLQTHRYCDRCPQDSSPS